MPRAKTNDQMLSELDALHRLGYRGHADFVDDNLIGNKKAVKAFLPDLRTWLEEHDYPFEFTTAALHVLIRGREIPLRSRQTELFERYKTLPPKY